MSRTPHAKPAHSTASIAFGFFSTETPVAAFTTPARKLTPLTSLLRLALPAQTVDATPSNQLIRQYFPWRTDLFGCTRSKPSQGSVPADLTLASKFGPCFQYRLASSQCCVHPLRPPGLPDMSRVAVYAAKGGHCAKLYRFATAFNRILSQ